MFGQAAAAAMQAKQETNNADTDENDDQPPKVEIKQVVEDDAIHSVRYDFVSISILTCFEGGESVLAPNYLLRLPSPSFFQVQVVL